jgi:hypothetical protein
MEKVDKVFREVNGTSYDARTSDEVVRVLEEARKNRTRIIVDYGDTETGQSWREEFDVTGYVGRSTGSIRIPLLIYNSRSSGGGGILDSSIVKITTSSGKRVLYSHENYTA